MNLIIFLDRIIVLKKGGFMPKNFSKQRDLKITDAVTFGDIIDNPKIADENDQIFAGFIKFARERIDTADQIIAEELGVFQDNVAKWSEGESLPQSFAREDIVNFIIQQFDKKENKPRLKISHLFDQIVNQDLVITFGEVLTNPAILDQHKELFFAVIKLIAEHNPNASRIISDEFGYSHLTVQKWIEGTRSSHTETLKRAVELIHQRFG